MSGIWGWMNVATGGRSTLELTESMTSGSAPAILQEAGEHHGMFATGKDTAVERDVGVVVAIRGRLAWENSEFADNARINGDARALLDAYQRHGAGCLPRLRGDFALTIIDSTRHTALIAIDRMGIQTLCYSINARGDLVFGTSADQVLRHPDITTDLAPQSLFNYVYFHFLPSPDSIYKDIRKLEPGQFLSCHDGRIETGRYWQPRFYNGSEKTHDASLEKELRDGLRAAVRRCAPDDNTGAFLSGGLDSSTVCGLLSEQQPEHAHAYSMGFDASGYDEMEYARIAARHFGLSLHEYYVTPNDIVDAIPRVARAYDEPFGNSSAIPTLLCAQFAHEQGSSVLLAGDGGDELFAGNSRYVKQQIFEMYHHAPRWLRRGVLEPLLIDSGIAARVPGLAKGRSYIEQARLPMPARTESYNLLNRVSLETVFDRDFLSTIDTRHPLTLLERTYNAAPAESMLDRMLFLDWKFTLADNDLRKVRRMCEIAGVEVRFPMLDEALVDLSARVPPTLKIRRLRLRHFYKQALKDYLPAAIINKTKHGFGLPFGAWLKSTPALQDQIFSSLSDLRKREIFNPGYIDTLIKSHRSGHAAYYGTMIWVLAMLEQWFIHHSGRR